MFGERLARKLMGGYSVRSRPPRFRVRRRPRGEDARGPKDRQCFILILAAVTTVFALLALSVPQDWLDVLVMIVIASTLFAIALAVRGAVSRRSGKSHGKRGFRSKLERSRRTHGKRRFRFKQKGASDSSGEGAGGEE